MDAYSADMIEKFVARGRDHKLTQKERGDALEDLICYLLENVPGIRLRRNAIDRAKSMEIDVTAASRQEGWMTVLNPLFLVECKNWSDPVDSKAINDFSTKLLDRNIKDGLLIAANGITGDSTKLSAAHHRVIMSQSRGQRITVLKLEEICVVNTPEEFTELIVARVLDVASSGTL